MLGGGIVKSGGGVVAGSIDEADGGVAGGIFEAEWGGDNLGRQPHTWRLLYF